MNTVKTVLATLFVLAVLVLFGWATVWGLGFLQELLAPIDPSTMALVVAGWIGVWGAAMIVVLGLRFVYGRADRMKRRERRADIYAYLLDTWAEANGLGDVPASASASTRDAYAEVYTSHRQAERRLALHGSSSVIDAYMDARDEAKSPRESVREVIVQMRRDLGYSTFATDTEALLALSAGEGLPGKRKTSPHSPREVRRGESQSVESSK